MAFVTFMVVLFVATVGTLNGNPTRPNDVVTSSARLVKVDSLTGKHTSLHKQDIQKLGRDNAYMEIHFENGWPSLGMHIIQGSVLSDNSVMVVRGGPHSTGASHALNANCYLRGKILDQDGDITLNRCDKMSGRINTPEHHYRIEEVNTEGENSSLTHTPFKVTRQSRQPEELDQEHDQEALNLVESKAMEMMEEGHNNETIRVKRGGRLRHLTIELALFLDHNYLDFLYYEKNFNEDDVREFIISKWNTIQSVYDDSAKIGARVTIALKKIELWWRNPSGYPANNIFGVERLNWFCENTPGAYHYDMRGLYTKNVEGKEMGRAWLGNVCDGNRKNCFWVKSRTESARVEIHEMGHVLGFKHDPNIGHCNREKGFMGWDDTLRYLPCYKRVLQTKIRNGRYGCLFRENVRDHE